MGGQLLGAKGAAIMERLIAQGKNTTRTIKPPRMHYPVAGDGSSTGPEEVDLSSFRRLYVEVFHLGYLVKKNFGFDPNADAAYWVEINLMAQAAGSAEASITSAVKIKTGVAFPSTLVPSKLIYPLVSVASTVGTCYRYAWRETGSENEPGVRFATITAPDEPIGTTKLLIGQTEYDSGTGITSAIVPLGWQLETFEIGYPYPVAQQPDPAEGETPAGPYDAIGETLGFAWHGRGWDPSIPEESRTPENVSEENNHADHALNHNHVRSCLTLIGSGESEQNGYSGVDKWGDPAEEYEEWEEGDPRPDSNHNAKHSLSDNRPPSTIVPYIRRVNLFADPPAGDPEIEVSGNGEDIACGDLGPSTDDGTDFEGTPIGTPISQSFKIYNSGTGNLTIGTVAVPSGFTVATQPDSVIFPGGYSNLVIQLDAEEGGVFSGSVSIPNNDPDDDEDPFTFAITGEVYVPEIDIRGNGVSIANGDDSLSTEDWTDFGSVFQGVPASKVFTIHNTSEGGVLDVDSVTVPAGFTVTASPSATVQAGENTSVTIRLDATAAGVYSGNVSIANNDDDENPYVFAITGTVLAPPTTTTEAP